MRNYKRVLAAVMAGMILTGMVPVNTPVVSDAAAKPQLSKKS